MSVRVLEPGLQTTVQDVGRPGYQRMGIAIGGAMDLAAMRWANHLVGNPPEAAGLEICLVGPVLQFQTTAHVALCGACMSARMDGDPFPQDCRVELQSGVVLDCGRAEHGVWAYLAFAGGLDVPQVLGGRGTDLKGRFGGYRGRPLQSGDLLNWDKAKVVMSPVSMSEPSTKGTQWSPKATHAKFSLDLVSPDPRTQAEILRIVPGREWDLLDEASQRAFTNEPFTISPESNRMGYRLAGRKLTLKEPTELISSAVCPGTIQLPPGGDPILLMADAPTVGGYPRIAHRIEADRSRAAQLGPGDLCRFEFVTLSRAQELLRKP